MDEQRVHGGEDRVAEGDEKGVGGVVDEERARGERDEAGERLALADGQHDHGGHQARRLEGEQGGGGEREEREQGQRGGRRGQRQDVEERDGAQAVQPEERPEPQADGRGGDLDERERRGVREDVRGQEVVRDVRVQREAEEMRQRGDCGRPGEGELRSHFCGRRLRIGGAKEKARG